MHNQPREPQPYEDYQAKLIQEFRWTSQGMDWGWGQGIKSHHTFLHKPRSTTRTPDPPFILDTLSPLDTLFYYFCSIKASPRPDATPTVSVVCTSRHTGGECGQAEPRQHIWATPADVIPSRPQKKFVETCTGMEEQRVNRASAG